MADLPRMHDDLAALVAQPERQADICERLRALLGRELTREQIVSSKLGTLVNGIRKNPALGGQVAKLAEQVLLHWKPVMLANNRDDKSSSQTPSLPPSPVLDGKRPSEDNPPTSSSSSTEDGAKRAKTAYPRLVSQREFDEAVRDFCPEHDTRAKSFLMFVKALQVEEEEDREEQSSKLDSKLLKLPDELTLATAHAIEGGIFHGAGSEASTQYKQTVRAKYLNLSHRTQGRHLRQALLDGSLKATTFCTMSSQEMASEDRKRELQAMRTKNLSAAQAASDTQAETDQFKCGRCHQRRCKYYQLQTRSADEPMTTFVTCTNCGNRWKFC